MSFHLCTPRTARALRAVAATVFALVAALLTPTAHAADKPLVVATTGMVADLVQQVGGDAIEVHSLMGPGVDPHLYKPTSSDVRALQQAAAIFYNGLHLEGKMIDVLERLARQKIVVAIADDLPHDRVRHDAATGGTADPHVWFDVALWSETVPDVVEGLVRLLPDQADALRERGAATQTRLRELHAWVQQRVAEVPEGRRVLVTSHDAFNYFGRAYGFEVIGLQGISTVTEASLGDVARLADLIRERGVPAIFVESSVSPATIERVSRDSGARIGGELFSDAMGVPGQMEGGYDLGTYDGMVRHNVNKIVEALR